MATSLVLYDIATGSQLHSAPAHATRSSNLAFLGAGHGGFLAEARYPAGTDPFDLRSADLDRDGHADLVVSPLDLARFSTFDTRRHAEVIEIGYRAALDAMASIRALL